MPLISLELVGNSLKWLVIAGTFEYVWFLADPGKARGCSTRSLVINSVSQSVILFLPQPYGAATPNWLKIAPPINE
jgi:hypothetical protein